MNHELMLSVIENCDRFGELREGLCKTCYKEWNSKWTSNDPMEYTYQHQFENVPQFRQKDSIPKSKLKQKPKQFSFTHCAVTCKNCGRLGELRNGLCRTCYIKWDSKWK